MYKQLLVINDKGPLVETHLSESEGLETNPLQNKESKEEIDNPNFI